VWPKSVPLKMRTRVVTPRPAVATMSALPSRLKSPAATRTPPRWVGIEGEEVADTGIRYAVEDCHPRAAALFGAGDDVGFAIAGHIRYGQEDTAAEFGFVSEEVLEDGAVRAAEDADARPAADSCRRDNVFDAVAVDIAGGDAHAAHVVGFVGIESESLHARAVVEGPDERGVSRGRGDDDERGSGGRPGADAERRLQRDDRLRKDWRSRRGLNGGPEEPSRFRLLFSCAAAGAVSPNVNAPRNSPLQRTTFEN